MIKILLADLVIEIDNKCDYFRDFCNDYLYDGDKPTDIFVKVTEEDIIAQRNAAEEDHTDEYLESIAAYRKIADEILKFDAFVMHGTVVKVEEKGIMFTAVSGTGKTTHMLYWMKLLGVENVKVINGDKPIIRFFDGVPYAFGTPWCGKEGLNTNDRVVLSDICLIERGEVDEAFLATKMDVFSHFIKQIYRPSKTELISQTFDLAGKLFKYSNLRKFKCRKNISAAKTAYDAIFGKQS